MPAVEALLSGFEAAHTQVLGVSVDSIFSHANWAAKDLGGVSFPLLADFHPKGRVAAAYGAYLEQAGISDRATVIIDASGIVRYAESVTPAGERDMAALVAQAAKVDKEFGAALPGRANATGIASNSTLFVKSRCGFSKAVLLARDNLHLGDALPVRNVSEDPSAMEALRTLAGKETAPCLIADGRAMHESKEIIAYLVSNSAPLES